MFKIWDKQESLYSSDGRELTAAEALAKYPWAKNPRAKVIIGDGVINLNCFLEFEAEKQNYKLLIEELKKQNPTWTCPTITETSTDKEVLLAIEHYATHQPPPQPSSEERIAAAMEFQNLMSI